MTRAVLSAAIDTDWTIVSELRPCPICGATTDCSLHSGAEFACCVREPSEWPLTNGAWLHRIGAEAESDLPAAPATLRGAELDKRQSGMRIRF